MKPRTQPKRLSNKKLASLGGKYPRSTVTAKPKPIRKEKAKRKSWKRKPSEFKRIYGSKARVEFVKSLACAACSVVGYSENAHVLGNGGTGRKADYKTIAPLCGQHPMNIRPGNYYAAGCHYLYDNAPFSIALGPFDPLKAADATQSAWLLHIGEAHPDA